MKNNFKLDSIKQFIDLDGEDLNDLVVRKGYLKESQLKISDDDERTILADISTQDVDSDGDIVLAKGCDLNRYLKNPIITINHSYITQDIVGSTKQIEVLDDRIRCKIKLNDTDSALNLWKQVRAGDIRGNSIGFVIKEAVIKGTKEFDTVQKMYNLKTNDAKRIITKYLLIENSIVALPANPDALNVEVSKKSLVKVEDYNIDDKIQKGLDRIIKLKGLTKEDIDKYSPGYKELILGAISWQTHELLKEYELEELQSIKEEVKDDPIKVIDIDNKIKEVKQEYTEDWFGKSSKTTENTENAPLAAQLDIEAKEAKTLNIEVISTVAEVAKVEVIPELVKELPKVLIIERLGGLDIKQMYEDYKSGKII
jgi:hypothetical protein